MRIQTFVTILLGLLLGCQARAIAQQHAPTTEQCQADARGWANQDEQIEYMKAETARLKSGSPNRTETNRLPIREVIARNNEMGTCEDVDPDNLKLYFEAQRFYTTVLQNREHNFIVRHHLFGQLLAEDAKGLR